jgi:predicted DNA-binding transcriptional regulator AlpA
MAETNNPLQELLTERDVARLLKVSVGTIRRRRLLRQPPHPVRIGGSVRYTANSIAALLAELQTGTQEPRRAAPASRPQERMS